MNAERVIDALFDLRELEKGEQQREIRAVTDQGLAFCRAADERAAKKEAEARELLDQYDRLSLVVSKAIPLLRGKPSAAAVKRAHNMLLDAYGYDDSKAGDAS